ncbi:MAG: holo-ACP synthase [Ilumatobacteraceae bacterium]|jgi:holo-[acyl-carrier protein] synthase|nr:holo-ACP synthase [Ilumatobacteraceae bacterium]MDP4703154.1 holo-ACP synthase [Ilumatobacteraceae bacterium]MDP5108574.1 holo-ACP synthase [Ilumatobacteraceae bacterium]
MADPAIMIGLGVDAVDIERFRDVLSRTPSLKTRVFTSAELELAGTRKDATGALAARFAVREATMKALGVGLGAFDFHDVSVRKAASGAPELIVSGRAQELAEQLGITQWRVSLSHTYIVAVAVVAAS